MHTCVQVFQPVFSAASTLDLIAAHSVTAFIAVPAMVVSLTEAAQSPAAAESVKLTHEQASSSAGPNPGLGWEQILSAAAHHSARNQGSTANGSALTCVKRILLGGGELPEHLQRRLHLLFPYAHCTTAYGMTEACSSITFRPMQLEADPFHSRSCAPVTSRGPASRPETRPASAEGVCVGDPPPGIEVAVLCSTSAAESSEMGTEEAAQSLPRVSAVLGAVGEVVTRGPHVMLGYWGDPGASTGAILPGGWLRTGDLGRLDAGGALWLLGRLKDVVRSGSENVNAAAVERVLLQVPGVAGAAVVGLPHDRLGEQVCHVPKFLFPQPLEGAGALAKLQGDAIESEHNRLRLMLGPLQQSMASSMPCLQSECVLLFWQVSALLVLHANVEWSGRDLRSSANFGDDIRSKSPTMSGASSDRLTLSHDKIVSLCRQKGLSSYMVPRTFLAQYEPLPTNSSGKVLKHAVREQILQWLSSQQQAQSRL